MKLIKALSGVNSGSASLLVTSFEFFKLINSKKLWVLNFSVSINDSFLSVGVYEVKDDFWLNEDAVAW